MPCRVFFRASVWLREEGKREERGTKRGQAPKDMRLFFIYTRTDTF